MAPDVPSAVPPASESSEGDQLIDDLAFLQGELVRLLRERQQNDKERKRVRSAIAEKERGFAILQGDRYGGRPVATFEADSFCSAVANVLLADPERVWTPTDVAVAMNEARHRVSVVLSRLVTYNRIDRVGRGQYRGRCDRPLLSPKRVFSRKEDFCNEIVALLDASSSRVWNADAVAEALQARKRSVQDLLSELNAVSRVKRIGKGRYVSVKADLSRFRISPSVPRRKRIQLRQKRG